MPYTLDKPIADYSISQLVSVYNDIARYNGTPTRNSTFRDKKAAIKAVENALVQANANPEPEDFVEETVVETKPLKAQLQESLAETETKAEPVAGKRRGRKTTITGNEVIVPLFTKYPLPAGGKPAARWAHYTDGMTIDQFGVALRDRKQAIADVRWYVRKGHVKLA